jgi:hypothetical protein
VPIFNQIQAMPFSLLHGHMPSNSIQSKANLGKIISVALKYLIFTRECDFLQLP